LSPKNDPLRQRPGPGKAGQNNPKKIICDVPQKISNPKRKNFFFFQFWLQDLLNP